MSSPKRRIETDVSLPCGTYMIQPIYGLGGPWLTVGRNVLTWTGDEVSQPAPIVILWFYGMLTLIIIGCMRSPLTQCVKHCTLLLCFREPDFGGLKKLTGGNTG